MWGGSVSVSDPVRVSSTLPCVCQGVVEIRGEEGRGEVDEMRMERGEGRGFATSETARH